MTTDVAGLRSAEAQRQNQWAMRWSLAVGVCMLAGKGAAFYLTGSAAILSDAIESVIHVVAVAFAAFSVYVSTRPPDARFPYGYERIAFFSAGFEGALIILAAVSIIWTSVDKWLGGLHIERLGAGALIVAAASLVNGGLGWYLIRTGRRTNSIILEANGKHVLTDCWTSFGVVGGLCLVLLTGWLPFDPILAIAVALNILWSGGHLIFRSVGGLMDYTEPRLFTEVRAKLDGLCHEVDVEHHGLRVRHTGYRLLIEAHLLFPGRTTLVDAHRMATLIEDRLAAGLPHETEVVTHLEAVEDHANVHIRAHGDDRQSQKSSSN